MARRLMLWSGLLLVAALAAGCEEGEAIDLPLDGDEADRTIDLTLVTANPTSTGVVTVRATVREDLDRAPGVFVTFTATNGTQQRQCLTTRPSDGETDLQGQIEGDCSPQNGDAQIIVKAETESPIVSDSITVTLDP